MPLKASSRMLFYINDYHKPLFDYSFYYLFGRYTNIRWLLFILISFGWEMLELVLPYEFAIETIPNKLVDILFNFFGYCAGLYFKGQKNK